MRKYLIYILLFLFLVVEILFEKQFPIFTLMSSLVIITLIIVGNASKGKQKIIHSLSTYFYYILTYILVSYYAFVTVWFLGYSRYSDSFNRMFYISIYILFISFIVVDLSMLVRSIQRLRSIKKSV